METYMRLTTRQRLLVSVVAIDLLAEINEYIEKNQIKFTLDYTNRDKTARLYIHVGDTKDLWCFSNHRDKTCIVSTGISEVSRNAIWELTNIAEKHDSGFGFYAQKLPNKVPTCKLQIRVKDARTIALTIAEAELGQVKTETHFELPA